MFTSDGAFSGFSIDDPAAAQHFYGDQLGIRVSQNAMGFLELHLASGAMVLAYVKPDHQPATFTILNFEVDDIDSAVDDLATRGVTMTRYPGVPLDDKGIMRGNGPDIAWFTDPAGNVLSVIAAGAASAD